MFMLLAFSDPIPCGNFEIPAQIGNIIATIINLIKIGVPILLIVFGMLDLGKSVMAQKEDEIKKGQQLFIKRLISAAIVFFVVTVTVFIISLVDTGDDKESNAACFKSIVTGSPVVDKD